VETHFAGSSLLPYLSQLTIKVLPLEDDRKNQRVACGDLSGVVQCFSVKRGEVTTAFKTLPAPSQKVCLSALALSLAQSCAVLAFLSSVGK
jgi:hypothetical protein